MASPTQPAGVSGAGRKGIPGPNARRIRELDRRFVSPSYTRPYPLVVRRASGVTVEDVDANEFLDFTAGLAVVATGHCHPRVVEAIRQQADELAKKKATTEATAILKKAWTATRDVKQAQQIATRLKETGVSVSVAEHFGVAPFERVVDFLVSRVERARASAA